jgi:alpha-glucosidase (family GH31 glycosyl hydrolase)
MIDIYRYYTWLHHELAPYAYSEGIRASRTGHPIATPLVFEYPDDPAVGDMWDEYLYGPWLLVAPVWRDGERSRSVYLPAGAWTEFWDDTQLLEGPATLSDVSVPLDRIPLYIRLGAIVPLEVVNGVTGLGGEASAGRLTLAIYPHRTSRYELHDHKESMIEIVSEKRGDYDETAAIRVRTSVATKAYMLRIRANFDPSRVVVNGTPLTPCEDQPAFDDPDATCAWLADNGRVLVKYATSGQPATIDLVP